MKRFFLFVIIMAVSCANLFADELQLVTGEILKGEIVSRSSSFVRIRLEQQNIQKEFLLDKVSSITTDEGKETINALLNDEKPQYKPSKTSNRKQKAGVTMIDNKYIEETLGPDAVFSSSLNQSYSDKDKKSSKKINSKMLVLKSANKGVSKFFRENKMPLYLFISLMLLGSLIFYFLMCMPLYILADKTKAGNKFFAWIPFLNIYLTCKIAQKPGWWMILFFLPVVNIVIAIVIWCSISEICKKPLWLGLLMIFPLVNIILPWFLALSCAENTQEDNSKKESKNNNMIKVNTKKEDEGTDPDSLMRKQMFGDKPEDKNPGGRF